MRFINRVIMVFWLLITIFFFIVSVPVYTEYGFVNGAMKTLTCAFCAFNMFGWHLLIESEW